MLWINEKINKPTQYNQDFIKKMEFKRSVKNKHKQKQKNIFFVAVIVFLKKIKIKK